MAPKCIRLRLAVPTDHEMQGTDLAAAQPIIDKRMTGRVRVTAGPHDVGFTWKERPSKLQDVWEPSRRDSQEVHMVGGHAEAEDRVDRRPVQRARRERRAQPATALCVPSRRDMSERSRGTWTRRAARTRSSRISRAARIGVLSPPADVEAPLSFYKQARQSGGNFDDGIRAGVARVLSSPYFLYRIENDPAGARAGVAHPVSDVELASRLSFFLWSSIPDEKLLDLAAAGRLREPEVLTAQVHRMLADDRSDALVENFTGQWLQLRNLEAKVVPDLLMFPDFDDNIAQGIPHGDRDVLRVHFARRPQRSGTFERGLHLRRRAARPALRHPGRLRPAIPAGEAHRSQSPRSAGTRQHPLDDFRRDQNLAGLPREVRAEHLPRTRPRLRRRRMSPRSTKATRTSKVPKTVRAQLELHRKNQPCAGCHRVIDPVGFALENFDSVGQWRDKGADGAPLDVAGTLADGSQVNGPVALREAIAEPARRLRDRRHRKDADVRAGPRAGAYRHAGGSPHREEGRAERLPAVFHCHGNCRKRAVPDAHQVGTGGNRPGAGGYC